MDCQYRGVEHHGISCLVAAARLRSLASTHPSIELDQRIGHPHEPGSVTAAPQPPAAVGTLQGKGCTQVLSLGRLCPKNCDGMAASWAPELVVGLAHHDVEQNHGPQQSPEKFSAEGYLLASVGARRRATVTITEE